MAIVPAAEVSDDDEVVEITNQLPLDVGLGQSIGGKERTAAFSNPLLLLWNLNMYGSLIWVGIQ